MKRNVIYFIDEDEDSRAANARALVSLLDNPDIEIRPSEPFRAMADYDRLVALPTTASFILDQRMKGSGKVNYNGTDLAAYLRRLDSKVPIYILTGHPEEDDDFYGSNYLVEHIIGKDEIEDPQSEPAITVKARLLRHLNIFNDVRDEQSERFHQLLLKSLKETLTDEEQAEMDSIEGEHASAILAIERKGEKELRKAVEDLKKFYPSKP